MSALRELMDRWYHGSGMPEPARAEELVYAALGDRLFVLVDPDGGIGRSFLNPSVPAVYLTRDDADIARRHASRPDLRVVEYAEVNDE